MKRAHSLRRQMSLPEVLLWRELRRRPAGLKFRRQFPFGQITADFACFERRVVVEVDGEAHNRGDQPSRDAVRDALLRREGFRVLRLAAVDVLRDLQSSLREIVVACSVVGPLHHPRWRGDGPPPRFGED